MLPLFSKPSCSCPSYEGLTLKPLLVLAPLGSSAHHMFYTAAMAGLAFTCLKRSNFNPGQRQRITMAIRTIQEKILKAQTPEGYFGNVYSTPLALQVGKRPWSHGHPGEQ
ncbi:Transcobalamin-2 [Saguinus oedipus]|uniref:Transcobalamin-2 n=1 Tax=Saguinus oedipus TaxID=9490 RepID=A0ABQ9WIT8_SAGOE|nr:Transcobalamin-2 [Saguinus oedipus]